MTGDRRDAKRAAGRALAAAMPAAGLLWLLVAAGLLVCAGFAVGERFAGSWMREPERPRPGSGTVVVVPVDPLDRYLATPRPEGRP